MRGIALSLEDGAQGTMTDDVIEAVDAAHDAIALLSPQLRQQVENAQQQINQAYAAVQVCHAHEQALLRAGLQEAVDRHANTVSSCQTTLEHFEAEATRQCAIAQDCLCDEARVRATDQATLCAAVTETYETAFCEHRHMCGIFRQCHSNEAEVFGELRASVEAEMAIVVQEYIAAEQAACITDLIIGAMTPPITPIPHAALINCDNVDVSVLDIDYPTLPAEPAACPANAVGDPPCGGFISALEGQKCPYQHEERLFREPSGGSSEISLEDCFTQCAATPNCNHFSHGTHDGGNVCMGCTSLANAQGWSTGTSYNMLAPLGRYIRPIGGTAIYWEVAGVKYWVRWCLMCDETLPHEATPCHNHWVDVEQSYIDGLETDGGYPGTATGVQFECTQHPQFTR